jgi:catechol 2,3-dioxygenase
METAVAPQLPATLRLGATYLTVSDLERALHFYAGGLGLQVERLTPREAKLGSGGETVLVLVEEPNAGPAGRHAGLYHVALLYPSRVELARAGRRLIETRTQVDGTADHGTHEAIYLSDPDGNGIELAADRPRALWPDLSTLGTDGGPYPLDVGDLLSLVAEDAPRPQAGDGIRVGHLHLCVGDIPRGIEFYCDVLGFEITTNLGSAVFASAGGYHHHIGFNVWRGRGVGPAPAGTVGLRHWTIVLESAEDVDAVRERVLTAGIAGEERGLGFLVRDPWENAVSIESAAG